MKWSKYDLDLRELCIKRNKPIPGKPEAEYAVNWSIPLYRDADSVKNIKEWGKNVQVDVKFRDYLSLEDYWEAVRSNAAKNLTKLKAEIEVRNRL